MNNWLFANVADYWDNRNKNSIFVYSQIIGKYPPHKQEQIKNGIREAIFEQVGALNDKQLKYAAFIIADDIFTG